MSIQSYQHQTRTGLFSTNTGTEEKKRHAFPRQTHKENNQVSFSTSSGVDKVTDSVLEEVSGMGRRGLSSHMVQINAAEWKTVWCPSKVKHTITISPSNSIPRYILKVF